MADGTIAAVSEHDSAIEGRSRFITCAVDVGAE
jgi:hypothetical protein